jgi:hypothetical protein
MFTVDSSCIYITSIQETARVGRKLQGSGDSIQLAQLGSGAHSDLSSVALGEGQNHRCVWLALSQLCRCRRGKALPRNTRQAVDRKYLLRNYGHKETEQHMICPVSLSLNMDHQFQMIPTFFHFLCFKVM